MIVLVDAAADFPAEELRDQSPLDVARSPNARQLALEGSSGCIKLTAHDSSHAMARLCEACGFDSKAAAGTVRWGPLAARAAGLQPNSARFRALGHFITRQADGTAVPCFPDSQAEQVELLRSLSAATGVTLLPFGNGRFVLDAPGGFDPPPRSLTPTDLLDTRLERELRSWPAALRTLLEQAERCLADHAINHVRLDLGQNPIDGIWLWSGGSLSGVSPAAGLPGQAVLSSEPLALSLGQALGLTTLGMESPYSLDRYDAAFDMTAFLELLDHHHELVVWVPAPFARGPQEGHEEKVRRLDAIDYYITGPIRAVLETLPSARMLLAAAGVRHRGRPEKGRAPFVLWGDGVPADATTAWSEREGARGDLGTLKFSTLLSLTRN